MTCRVRNQCATSHIEWRGHGMRGYNSPTRQAINVLFLILGIILTSVGGAGQSNQFAQFAGNSLPTGILVFLLFFFFFFQHVLISRVLAFVRSDKHETMSMTPFFQHVLISRVLALVRSDKHEANVNDEPCLCCTLLSDTIHSQYLKSFFVRCPPSHANMGSAPVVFERAWCEPNLNRWSVFSS